MKVSVSLISTDSLKKINLETSYPQVPFHLFKRHSIILSDRVEGDEDEPDLALLTTLDFAALKDVKETGADFCRHFEALLHNTPGLQPGYLPERDASYLLNGVNIFTNNFQALLIFLVTLCAGFHFSDALSFLCSPFIYSHWHLT